MKIWLDAHLSPQIARWIGEEFGIEAVPVRDIDLRDASDEEIFFQAKNSHVIVMTKDSDFLSLIDQYGIPPQVIWLTCGNTSNDNLKRILTATLKEALNLVSRGDAIVEIAG